MRHTHRGRRAALPALFCAALFCAALFCAALFAANPVASGAVPADDPNGAHGVGDSYFPESGNGGYDALDYQLDIEVDVDAGEVEARLQLRARATQDLQSFSLDFVGLEISEIQVDGEDAVFRREEPELVIEPAQPIRAEQEFVVIVSYSGAPDAIDTKALPIGVGWQYQKGEVYVMSEPVGARGFVPVNDHPSDKATWTLRVTVDVSQEVAATGRLIATSLEGDRRTFTWRSQDPVASYLVTICIGSFDVERSDGPNGLPMRHYFPHGVPANRKAPFAKAGEMIEFFSERFGPYPFEAFGGVLSRLPFPGALETQTIPVYGLFAGEEKVISHELAHQWFGNSVSVTDWKDIWICEGFAEYAAWLWEARDTDEADFEEQMEDRREMVANMHVGPSGDPGPSGMFGLESYMRGPLVLHALRRHVGDVVFFDVLKAWCARYRHGNATIEDFIALSVELSDAEAEPILRSWLYDKRVPDLPDYRP